MRCIARWHAIGSLAVSSVLALIAVPLAAQDQRILVPATFDFRADTLKETITGLADAIPRERPQLVHDAILGALRVRHACSPGASLEICTQPLDAYLNSFGKGTTAVLHVARLNPDGAAIKSQSWYAWAPNDHAANQVASLRIYGASTVVFVYLHEISFTDSAKAYARLPADAQATFIDFLAGKPTELQSPSGGALVELELAGDKLIIDQQHQTVYRIDVTRKTPTPISNLTAVLGAAQGAVTTVAIPLTERVWVGGAYVARIHHVPSEMAWNHIGTKAGAEVELAKQVYDNEGRYYWDVSVALPISKVEEVQFDVAGGLVTPRKVDRATALALLNVYPIPVDAQGVKLAYPGLVLGVGLSNRPWERLLLGATFGLNKISLFGGYQWTKVFAPATLEAGQAATPGELEADKESHYERTFVVGVNAGVKQALELLKGK